MLFSTQYFFLKSNRNGFSSLNSRPASVASFRFCPVSAPVARRERLGRNLVRNLIQQMFRRSEVDFRPVFPETWIATTSGVELIEQLGVACRDAYDVISNPVDSNPKICFEYLDSK